MRMVYISIAIGLLFLIGFSFYLMHISLDSLPGLRAFLQGLISLQEPYSVCVA